VNKKLIIIMAGAGLLSFSGAFVLARLTKKTTPAPPSQSAQPTTSSQTKLKEPYQQFDAIGTTSMEEQVTEKTLAERHLKELIFDVREKIREYDQKLQSLEKREQRLQITQETLRKDIEELDNLRVELSSTVVSLKNERDRLQKSRVEINKAEKTNLVSIAATYDKMDAASASQILTNMCSGQVSKISRGTHSSMDDAVKIMYYMAERTKAKLLAELVSTEPKLAAVLCQRLKQVVEGE
jgi:DNA repair exonuclease SbcCD ATPase subunit